MAKVSRRTKKETKAEVKPEFKIEEIIIEKPSNVLSANEILQLETSPLLIENAKYFMAIQEQSLANMLLEHKLLTNKIEKQRQVVVEAAQKYQTEKERYNASMSTIMKNHGLISEKFGYNNETGEIIL